MSTRRQLSLLLTVLIGGTFVVSAGGVLAIILIRNQILHLSEETSPTQVKLAKLQRGFERISGSFARISTAGSQEDISAVAREFEQTMSEVDAIAAQLAEGSGERVDAEVLKKLSATGKQLRQIAEERIRSRQQLAEANRRVGAELESVGKSTHGFTESMAEMQRASQQNLEASKKTNLEANSNIKGLLIAREKIEQLRSVVHEVRRMDKKYRLNPLRDRARGMLDGITSLDFGDKNLNGQLKAFVDSFGATFESEGGLLTLRGSVIQSPDDAKARAAYDDKHKALAGSIDTLSGKIAELIDPLQLAVRKANIGMNEATEQIATVSTVSAAAAEVNAHAKSLQALAWQLLTVSEGSAVDRLASEIGTQVTGAQGSTDQIATLLPKIKGRYTTAEAGAVRQSFTKVQQTLTGGGSVASVVRQGLAKQRDADQLFSEALASVQQIAAAGSRRAHDAEGAQEASVDRIRKLSGAGFLAFGLIGLAVLAAGSLVGRRVRNGILEAEQRQARDSEEMRVVLDRLRASQERHKILERVGEGVETLRETSRGLAETSEVVSVNAGSVAEEARRLEQTIRDISGSVVEASRTSAGAAEVVESATGAVFALATASGEIGKVTEMIRSIAFETNLLSLNAAIQAAHAGEKGAGFAVVARHIKHLAGAASESTSEIDLSIRAMDEHVGKVNKAIAEVARIIATMRSEQDIITAAVRAQTAATARIVTGIDQTAAGCKGDARSRGLYAMASELGDLAEDLARLCLAESS